jgi:hypothetical protein
VVAAVVVLPWAGTDVVVPVVAVGVPARLADAGTDGSEVMVATDPEVAVPVVAAERPVRTGAGPPR